MVAPRDGIMVPTPERKTTQIKSDVDQRVPELVALASAEAIFDYRPIDVVDRIAPRAAMFICVENDATTPEDHAFALYEKAGGPKRLVVQTGTTHYAAYAQYRDVVAPMIVEWFERYLVAGDIRGPRGAARRPSIRYIDGSLAGRQAHEPLRPRRSAAARSSPPPAGPPADVAVATAASPRSSRRATPLEADAHHRRDRPAPPARR